MLERLNREEIHNISQAHAPRTMSNEPGACSESLQVAPPPPYPMHDTSKKMGYDDYTVGWICTRPTVALAPATKILDEFHSRLPQESEDGNAYTLGRIGKHKIVIACVSTDTRSVGSVVEDMSLTFPTIQIISMVGNKVSNAMSDANHGLVNHHKKTLQMGHKADGTGESVHADGATFTGAR